MPKALIQPKWDLFNTLAIPACAGPQQRADMKMAYYAGAHDLVSMLVKGLSPGEVATDQDVIMLADVVAELEAHLRTRGLAGG